jgi:hypothetical protein
MENSLDNLEDFVGIESEPVADTPVEDTVTDEASPDPATTAGETVDDPPEEVETPVVEATDKEKAFQSGMMDERRKRQELEARVQLQDDRITQLLKPEAAEDDDKPDATEKFWENPADYAAQVAKEAAEAATSAERDRAWGLRAEWSQERARVKHEDYDTVEAEFIELAKVDPALITMVKSKYDPAEFVVSYMAAHKEGPFDPVKEREKMKAEILAELKGESTDPPKKKQTTTTLAGQRNAAPGKGSVELDDTDLLEQAAGGKSY